MKALRPPREGFHPLQLLMLLLLTFLVLLLCLGLGSVAVPPGETLGVLRDGLLGRSGGSMAATIILSVRLPRVVCVALVGAALSLAGAAMQGLLRNPLADGSTLGVSAGASLGAVVALALPALLPGLPGFSTMGLAILFGFLSLALILALAWRLDRSLATQSIILIGVIFSMFANSLISLLIAFSGERLRSITFWTLGSLSGSGYPQALALLIALLIATPPLMLNARALNALAMGEDNARSIGVDVRGVKLAVLICAAVLIGVCVAIGGTIGFVGLVTPHMVRLILGPNHKRLLPASLFGGAIFLMLADLASRLLLSPVELPIGVVTSFIGAILFVFIFFRFGRTR
ncbi:MAG: FecCD family ABC transporter permease [Christensenellales bacterium]